MGILPHPYIV